MRAMTMTPQEVISMLNRFHNDVVFPRAFKELRFDMVAEVEYHFAFVDAPKGKGKSKTSKRVVIEHTAFWMTPDRDPEGHFVIVFDEPEGKKMGRWLHNIVDPRTDAKKGCIGYSKNAALVREKMTAPGTIAVASVGGIRRENGSIDPA